MYFLDTNTISYLLEGNATVLQHYLKVKETDEIRIPDVVYYEIYRGLLVRDSKKLLSAFEDFCKQIGTVSISLADFKCAARIYADLRNRGEMIEDDDILIGAMAIDNNAILVTHNMRHFSRISGLSLETWVE